MITENLSTLKIHKLTQEQYDREFEAGRIDPNAFYLTPDEEGDLSSYATVEQLASKADLTHTHDITDVSGLQSALDVLESNQLFTITFIRDITNETWTVDKTCAELVTAIEAGIKVDCVYKTTDTMSSHLNLMQINYDIDGSCRSVRFQSSTMFLDDVNKIIVLGLNSDDEIIFDIYDDYLLPIISIEDNGKVMSVVDGEWAMIDMPTTEEWVFTLEDGSTVTKAVYVDV